MKVSRLLEGRILEEWWAILRATTGNKVAKVTQTQRLTTRGGPETQNATYFHLHRTRLREGEKKE